MAEPTTTTAVPVTKFYVSDTARTEIKNLAKATPGVDTEKLASDIIKNLEVGDALPPGMVAVLGNKPDILAAVKKVQGNVKPFQAGITEEINTIKPREKTLTLPELERYNSLLQAANIGETLDPTTVHNQVNAYKNSLIAKDISPEIALKAATKFIFNRDTGGVNVRDYLISQGVNFRTGPEAAKDAEIYQNEMLSFMPAQIGPGNFTQDIERVSGLLNTARGTAKEESRIAGQQALAEEQRGRAQATFAQALQAFQTPLPTYTPEFNAEMLGNIQQRIGKEGQRAISDVEARAAERGITGSSIEQFGLAETEGQILNSLRDATFQFLLNSGQAAQRNREFLADTLRRQSEVLLGAGQGTEQLVTGRELSGQELSMRRDVLANQIAQFNQQLAESRRQFDVQQQFAQEQAGTQLQLLLQQLSQPRQKRFGQAITGGASLGALAGTGFALALPGPGTVAGLALGAGIGAGAGGLLGGLGEAFGG